MFVEASYCAKTLKGYFERDATRFLKVFVAAFKENAVKMKKL